MHIGLVPPGRIVLSGGSRGKFLRMCGSDALVELDDGRRVMWSCYTDVELLCETEEVIQNVLPKLEAKLAKLECFDIGKYATLGLTTKTPCVELPKWLHAVFVTASIGLRPIDAVLCRRCTTELCIRADHLFWGTRSDCQRDMCLRGLARPGRKQVTAADIALTLTKLRARISRLKTKLISRFTNGV